MYQLQQQYLPSPQHGRDRYCNRQKRRDQAPMTVREGNKPPATAFLTSRQAIKPYCRRGVALQSQTPFQRRCRVRAETKLFADHAAQALEPKRYEAEPKIAAPRHPHRDSGRRHRQGSHYRGALIVRQSWVLRRCSLCLGVRYPGLRWASRPGAAVCCRISARDPRKSRSRPVCTVTRRSRRRLRSSTSPAWAGRQRRRC